MTSLVENPRLEGGVQRRSDTTAGSLQRNTRTLYQHGTLALLVPGLLDGTLTIGELMRHGDTGIGTGEGLDGELIILNGKPYQARPDGSIVVVRDSFTLPFANMHWADFTPVKEVRDLTQKQITSWLPRAAGTTNGFFAATLTGRFSNMHTRVITKQRRPYPTLEQTAAQEQFFTAQQTEGTVLAYYSPQLFNGIAVGGFHIHYLADDLSIGGHVLDFHVEQAHVSIQQFDTLQEHLPVGNTIYSSHDFSEDDIDGAIEAAE